jgi:hypothetical protein
VFVFDAHSHLLHEGGEGAGVNYLMYQGDAEGMLEVHDWCGIDQVAMMSWSAPVCTDAHQGNEIVWRAMQRYGERIVGVAVIDPSHMTRDRRLSSPGAASTPSWPCRPRTAPRRSWP